MVIFKGSITDLWSLKLSFNRCFQSGFFGPKKVFEEKVLLKALRKVVISEMENLPDPAVETSAVRGQKCTSIAIWEIFVLFIFHTFFINILLGQ